MSTLEIVAGPVVAYDPAIAAGIGRLMPQLDPGFSGEPLQQHWLEETIASAYHDQLVATRDGLVVGAAAMSVVRGSGQWLQGGVMNRRGQLEDFVVDEAARGQGVAEEMWQAMSRWCNVKGLGSFNFESEAYRTAAWNFYKKMGAVLLEDTAHFQVILAGDA